MYEAGLHVPLIAAWPGHVRPGGHIDAMVSWLDLLPTLLEAAGSDTKAAAPGGIDGRSFLPVLTGAADRARDRIFGSHSGDGNVNFYPARSARLGSWK